MLVVTGAVLVLNDIAIFVTSTEPANNFVTLTLTSLGWSVIMLLYAASSTPRVNAMVFMFEGSLNSSSNSLSIFSPLIVTIGFGSLQTFFPVSLSRFFPFGNRQA